MKTFLVVCKDGSKWLPMGLTTNDDSGEHLFTDGPYSLFKTEDEAANWLTDAAAYHEDTTESYRIMEFDLDLHKVQ